MQKNHSAVLVLVGILSFQLSGVAALNAESRGRVHQEAAKIKSRLASKSQLLNHEPSRREAAQEARRLKAVLTELLETEGLNLDPKQQEQMRVIIKTAGMTISELENNRYNEGRLTDLAESIAALDRDLNIDRQIVLLETQKKEDSLTKKALAKLSLASLKLRSLLLAVLELLYRNSVLRFAKQDGWTDRLIQLSTRVFGRELNLDELHSRIQSSRRQLKMRISLLNSEMGWSTSKKGKSQPAALTGAKAPVTIEPAAGVNLDIEGYAFESILTGLMKKTAISREQLRSQVPFNETKDVAVLAFSPAMQKAVWLVQKEGESKVTVVDQDGVATWQVLTQSSRGEVGDFDGMLLSANGHEIRLRSDFSVESLSPRLSSEKMNARISSLMPSAKVVAETPARWDADHKWAYYDGFSNGRKIEVHVPLEGEKITNLTLHVKLREGEVMTEDYSSQAVLVAVAPDGTVSYSKHHYFNTNHEESRLYSNVTLGADQGIARGSKLYVFTGAGSSPLEMVREFRSREVSIFQL